MGLSSSSPIIIIRNILKQIEYRHTRKKSHMKDEYAPLM